MLDGFIDGLACFAFPDDWYARSRYPGTIGSYLSNNERAMNTDYLGSLVLLYLLRVVYKIAMRARIL